MVCFSSHPHLWVSVPRHLWSCFPPSLSSGGHTWPEWSQETWVHTHCSHPLALISWIAWWLSFLICKMGTLISCRHTTIPKWINIWGEGTTKTPILLFPTRPLLYHLATSPDHLSTKTQGGSPWSLRIGLGLHCAALTFWFHSSFYLSKWALYSQAAVFFSLLLFIHIAWP